MRLPGCAQGFAGVHSSPANLVLVCTRRHQLIHDEGYRLVLDPDRKLHVRAADGTALEHHPALLHSPAEDLPVVAADALEYGGERMDLGYVVNVMLAHAA